MGGEGERLESLLCAGHVPLLRSCNSLFASIHEVFISFMSE